MPTAALGDVTLHEEQAGDGPPLPVASGTGCELWVSDGGHALFVEDRDAWPAIIACLQGT